MKEGILKEFDRFRIKYGIGKERYCWGLEALAYALGRKINGEEFINAFQKFLEE